MLVLGRKVGQRIWIGEEISIMVTLIDGDGVRIGIEAPPDVPILREELMNIPAKIPKGPKARVARKKE